MKSLQVMITGASRGLGKAIARAFAAKGHHLYLVSRGAVALYQTLESLQTEFPEVTIRARPFDFADSDEAVASGEWVLQHAAGIDVLVNNAGIFTPGSLHEEEKGSLEALMQVNFFSAYHLARTLVPAMKAAGSGHIFNISSIAALGVYPRGSSYSVSKAALASFSKNLRDELKPFGIKVTTVFPGAVFTDSWEASGIDPKRIMKPADIADMIYAASQLSAQACVEEIIIRPQPGDV